MCACVCVKVALEASGLGRPGAGLRVERRTVLADRDQAAF